MTKQSVIKQFTSLKGVGEAKAELLYDNGINSMEKLKNSSVDDLLKIKGISQTIAEEILKQAQTDEKKQKKQPSKKPETKEKTPSATKQPTKISDTKIKEKVEEKPAETIQESVEIVDEAKQAYKAKKKPKLSQEKKQHIHVRKQIKKRTPTFLRQEWFRYKRIPHNWRRPTGITSKLRINLKYRPSKVRVGFRGPKDARGLHSSGFEEVMIYNINDLDHINPETQAARIGRTVGTKKRLEIAKKAEKLDIRILNMKV
ncbi:MAG: 50S ribosomal protein L32e [Thermoplasmatota archaeon]